MIKENQGLLNKIHVVLDAVVIVISYVLSWYLRFRSGIFEMDPWYLSLQVYMSVLIFIIPGYLLLYYIFQLYTPKRVRGRRLEAWNILQANTIGFLVFILVLYFRHQTDFSRTMIFVFYCINIFLEIVERNVIRMGLRKIRSQGFNQKHILLIGYSRAAEQYIDRILANPDWGYNIRGILADNVPRGTEYKKVRVLGRIDNLEIVLPENKLDEIVITLGLAEYHKLERIVKMCEKSGVHTKFIPDYNNVIPTKPYTEDLQGLPVINIRRVPLSDPLNKWMKRGVDIFGAIVAIILFSPVMIVRFIRKTSIDELPQLFNVLRGDMSLVGPRPERPQFVEKFKEEIPRYMIKHQVRPGLTGWAQVNGYRGDTSIKKRIEHDLYYIENWTLGFDFKIIFLTFFKGFINKNAY